MVGKRQQRVSNKKSLAELISSGGYRADRHWRLVLEGSQPDGVPDGVWQEIVLRAKAYLRKQMGDDRRRAEALLAASALTPKEVAAYEALIAELPTPDPLTPEFNAFTDDLRARPDFEKRTHVKMGMLDPFDLLKADELAGNEPIEFESWEAFFEKHPEGAGAPVRFKIARE